MIRRLFLAFMMPMILVACGGGGGGGGGGTSSGTGTGSGSGTDLDGVWLSSCDAGGLSGFSFSNATVRAFTREYQDVSGCQGSYEEVTLARADIQIGGELTTESGLTAQELDLQYTYINDFGLGPDPEGPRVGETLETIYRLNGGSLYLGVETAGARPTELDFSSFYSLEDGTLGGGGSDPGNTSGRNYGLVKYGIATEHPSIVTAAFKVYDEVSGEPVNGLTAEDFQVLEDGVEVPPLESYLDVETVGKIPYKFYTVLALDISTSLSPEDIATVKQTAKALVVDPETGESRLKPDQLMAIYTFAGSVTKIVSFTSDTAKLKDAIDGISEFPTSSSTSLNEVIVKGMSDWNNSFSMSQVTYGAMVVVTDGNDTAGINTTQQAIHAVGDKELYAIPVGSSVDLTAMETIAGAGHVFPAGDFSQLSAAFESVVYELNNFEQGLYFLYYASPKRSGQHEIDVSVIDNQSADSVSGVFSANGFSDVYPTIKLQIDKPAPEPGDVVTLSAKRLWTPSYYGAPNFTWTFEDADMGSAVVTQLDNDRVEVVFGMEDVTRLPFSVSESESGLIRSSALYAATGGIAIGYATRRYGEIKAFSDEVQFNQFDTKGFRTWDLQDPNIAQLPYSIPDDLSLIETSATFEIKGFSGLNEDVFSYEVISGDSIFDVKGNDNYSIYLEVNPDRSWSRDQYFSTVKVTNLTRGISKDFEFQWIHTPPAIYFSGDTIWNFAARTEYLPIGCLYGSSSCPTSHYAKLDYVINGVVPGRNYIYRVGSITKVSGGSECILEDFGYGSSEGYIQAGPFTTQATCEWDIDVEMYSSDMKIRRTLILYVE